MLCPKCGADAGDAANFCPNCGVNLGNNTFDTIAEIPPDNTEPVVTMTCEKCKSGELVPVEEITNRPLYRCSSCGYYFGDFMKLGNMIYYDTALLRVGQFVKLLANPEGSFEVSTNKDVVEVGSVADIISNDLSLSVEDVRTKLTNALGGATDISIFSEIICTVSKIPEADVNKALKDLVEINILETYARTEDEGERVYGLKFVTKFSDNHE